MLSTCRWPMSALLLTIALMPNVARAQSVAQSFDQLQGAIFFRGVVAPLDTGP